MVGAYKLEKPAYFVRGVKNGEECTQDKNSRDVKKNTNRCLGGRSQSNVAIGFYSQSTDFEKALSVLVPAFRSRLYSVLALRSRGPYTVPPLRRRCLYLVSALRSRMYSFLALRSLSVLSTGFEKFLSVLRRDNVSAYWDAAKLWQIGKLLVEIPGGLSVVTNVVIRADGILSTRYLSAESTKIQALLMLADPHP
ncbi:hypothetical protein J6590_064235 [Homalodisca vitripennis]|nr:hypothetical protein J6590_064235 [Homalodisca vitripennis]